MKQRNSNRLLASKHKNQRSETKVLRKQIGDAENRLSVISQAVKNLYLDKCTGNIPENTFKSLMNDFSTEQAEIEERLPKLKKELAEVQDAKDEISEWLELISNYTNIETLTRAIVTELIDSITVSDRVKYNGTWEQTIDINYRFIGDLLKPLNDDTKKENIA